MTDARIRLSARLPQGPLGPRAHAGEALPRREPARAGLPPLRVATLVRAGRGPQGAAATAISKSAVVEAMTTNETFFFRDQTPFDLFRDVLLPRYLASRAQRERLRIWCAAASTGQEPYSLAMILNEAAPQLAGWHVEIVATDISTRGARAGASRPLQPVRGAARPADPASPEALHPDRRPVADLARASARWSTTGSST